MTSEQIPLLTSLLTIYYPDRALNCRSIREKRHFCTLDVFKSWMQTTFCSFNTKKYLLKCFSAFRCRGYLQFDGLIKSILSRDTTFFPNVTDSTKEKMKWHLILFAFLFLNSHIRMSQKDISMFQARKTETLNNTGYVLRPCLTLLKNLVFLIFPGKKTKKTVGHPELKRPRLGKLMLKMETSDWDYRAKWPALFSIWSYLSIPPFIHHTSCLTERKATLQLQHSCMCICVHVSTMQDAVKITPGSDCIG